MLAGLFTLNVFCLHRECLNLFWRASMYVRVIQRTWNCWRWVHKCFVTSGWYNYFIPLQLEILTNLATETNISTILREFQVSLLHEKKKNPACSRNLRSRLTLPAPTKNLLLPPFRRLGDVPAVLVKSQTLASMAWSAYSPTAMVSLILHVN